MYTLSIPVTGAKIAAIVRVIGTNGKSSAEISRRESLAFLSLSRNNSGNGSSACDRLFVARFLSDLFLERKTQSQAGADGVL
jgi:hypothetical protein